MKDHPIIFSAPMILALLAGRKTMTRRLADQEQHYRMNGALEVRCKRSERTHSIIEPSPWQRVQPGDRLWVRENLCAMRNWGLWHDATPAPTQGCFLDDIDERGRTILDRYAPTEATDSALVPSIFMPRWSSRLTLTVTATKIERLQEISESDAIKEGIPRSGPENPLDVCRREFSELWRKLHGDGAWDENPEVVALSFTVHKQNIDALAEAA